MDEEEMLDTVMHQSLALKPDEDALVVTDPPMQFLGELFAFGACRVTNQMRLIVMPVAENHGSEPPYPVAKAMCETDVGLLLTSKSLSHTEAREAASASGARIASMPTITYEMALRTLAWCLFYAFSPTRRPEGRQRLRACVRGVFSFTMVPRKCCRRCVC